MELSVDVFSGKYYTLELEEDEAQALLVLVGHMAGDFAWDLFKLLSDDQEGEISYEVATTCWEYKMINGTPRIEYIGDN